jgi:hypothetical protein
VSVWCVGVCGCVRESERRGESMRADVGMRRGLRCIRSHVIHALVREDSDAAACCCEDKGTRWREESAEL